MSLPEHIGPFKIISSLGKGGMGEVFLAFDPICQREVALKRVRTDLATHEIIKNRFLREALITSKLAHPAIVPIYSIHEEEGTLYYIMPYLKGETLKSLIKAQEMSISSFLRIFIAVCQAVAYAHSKGYLHRDLKPENIIVGKYGQVHILDWGLVKEIADLSEDDQLDLKVEEGLTRPGKLVGTLAYLAPERILKHPSTISSDIYSLGVIFYQLLTFHIPFRRKNVKEFRQNLTKEKLINPETIAPYRDVPPELSRIVKKCLSFKPIDRYKSVDELIKDLENYLEGRSDWFLESTLSIQKKEDWEFQENVLIPGPLLSGRDIRVAEWVSLMISKATFSGNTQLKAKIKFASNSYGIGFLLSVPEKEERMHPTDGYCLWLSTNQEEPTKLFRSAVQVLEMPEAIIPKEEWCEIAFQKISQNIRCTINDKEIFSYSSHLPLTGTHIGLLYRDDYFEIEEIAVYIGNLNLQVSCLAIPDAFLDHKDYTKALLEYRRIAKSFPGRQEAREGLFRAGITLLEEGEKNHDQEKMLQALDEFEKLRFTPGAPLEYLGKALVYRALKDPEEEIKCFELGVRRYPHHPHLHYLEKEILYRLHNKSKQDRSVSYRFILLVLIILPKLAEEKQTHKLLTNAMRHVEKLFFQEETSQETFKYFALQLAFLLCKPYSLAEIFDTLAPEDIVLKKDALFSLLKVGAFSLFKERLPDLATGGFEYLKIAENIENENIEALLSQTLLIYQKEQEYDFLRMLFYFFDQLLKQDREELILKTYEIFIERIDAKYQLDFDCYALWAALKLKDQVKAQEILQKYSLEFLSQEGTLLHFLYGCFLYLSEGREIGSLHFSNLLDTPTPKIASLASHYLFGKGLEPTTWLQSAFPYEREELYKQLALFYSCSGNTTLASHYSVLGSN